MNAAKLVNIFEITKFFCSKNDVCSRIYEHNLKFEHEFK